MKNYWSGSYIDQSARKQFQIACKSAGKDFGNLSWKLVLQEMLLNVYSGKYITAGAQAYCFFLKSSVYMRPCVFQDLAQFANE